MLHIPLSSLVPCNTSFQKAPLKVRNKNNLSLQPPVIVSDPECTEIDLVSANSHLMQSEVRISIGVVNLCKVYLQWNPSSVDRSTEKNGTVNLHEV